MRRLAGQSTPPDSFLEIFRNTKKLRLWKFPKTRRNSGKNDRQCIMVIKHIMQSSY